MVVWIAMRTGPVSESGFVRGEVRAVANVTEGSGGDSAVEASDAVCTPDVEDNLAVAEGNGAGGRADERLLVDLDKFGGGCY